MTDKEIKIETSRCGLPTLKVGGIFLHSKYDPDAEASRFLKSLALGQPCQTLVLLGSGLGYLDAKIALAAPHLRLIVISGTRGVIVAKETLATQRVSQGKNSSSLKQDVTHENRCAEGNIFDEGRWGTPKEAPKENETSRISYFTGNFNDFAGFLLTRLDDEDLLGLKLVIWPAFSSLFPKETQTIRQQFLLVVQRFQASLKTVSVWGRKWIRGSLTSFLTTPGALLYRQGSAGGSLVVACSGPTLEKSLALLKKHRNKFTLWALPSSLAALQANGITADLLVTSDPGFYASLHLRYGHEYKKGFTFLARSLVPAKEFATFVASFP